MIRTLLIIVGLFAITAGFVWLKDTPGELALTVGGNVYAIGLAQAVLLVVIVSAISVIAYLALRLIWIAPGRALFAWRDRRSEQGRAAISRGLLAVAAGDLRQAEMASREAAKRAPDAPLTALLQAQAAQLKGDKDTASTAFTAMLNNQATRIAGLHGLFVEAERQGAREAARHYAETAYEARPDTSWAVRALLRFQAGEGDWDGALSTLAGATNTRALDKKLIRNHRAVLLTAKAMAGEDTDKERARQAALEAHQLRPDLAPAAIVAGRILSRAGEVSRAAKVLETAWKAAPHPEIADAYAHVRSGDSALDRMGRMEKLMRMRPHHDEGRMAYASAAIEAREFETARDTLKPIIATRPTRNALILMAELDEAEHGDRGRVREWLDRAVRAPRDPVWTADGIILEEWAPVSPVSGRIGAVEWKLPVDEGENRLSIDVDDDVFKPRAVLPIAAAATMATPPPAASSMDEPDISDEPDEGDLVDVTPTSAEPAPPAKPDDSTADSSAEWPVRAGANGEDTSHSPSSAVGGGESGDVVKTPTEAEAPSIPAQVEEPVPIEGRQPAEPEDKPLPPADEAADKTIAPPVSDDNQYEHQTPDTAQDQVDKDVVSETAEEDTVRGADAKPEGTAADTADEATEGAAEEKETVEGEGEDDEPKLPHLPPDDPGVDETEEPEPRGFRLF